MKKLALVLNDEFYGRKLSDFLSKYAHHEYSVALYTEENDFINSLKRSQVSVVITDEEKSGILENENLDCTDLVICLTESEKEEADVHLHRIIFIYKYSPATEILNRILKDKKSFREQNQSLSKMIAIYSPNGGLGSTSTSIAIAEQLSEDGKVLYICLEPFCCITESLFLDESNSLSELMYYFIAKGDIDEKEWEKYIQKTESFDVVGPVRNFVEMQSIDIKSWAKLFRFIKDLGIYKTVVIEMSEGVNGLLELFLYMDKVIVPFGEGKIRERKIEIFKKELVDLIGKEAHDFRLSYIKIPHYNNQEDEYEGIGMTKLGEWVKGMMNEI